MKVVDFETQKICDPKTIGELMVKNLYSAKHQVHDGENDSICSYIRTGDAAYYDLEGRIFVLGKIRGMIKTRRLQVFPSEIEFFIRKHDGVRDCAVITGLDGAMNLAIFIVRCNKSDHFTATDIKKHIAGKVEGLDEMRTVVYFLAEIPRSPCGKLLTKQLRLYWETTKNARRKASNMPALITTNVTLKSHSPINSSSSTE
ncbi:hypothetical protein AB6A40_007630 [Gnathostoma spinigerum]|uniref:AMP-binding enzyme C-terminal domain-containing protein n=1 Tax=Gnathostoma spinigerum TaxID=75299 RepID=A0ABD6ETZ3_9BILA